MANLSNEATKTASDQRAMRRQGIAAMLAKADDLQIVGRREIIARIAQLAELLGARAGEREWIEDEQHVLLSAKRAELERLAVGVDKLVFLQFLVEGQGVEQHMRVLDP